MASKQSLFSFNSIKGKIIRALFFMGIINFALVAFYFAMSSNLENKENIIFNSYQPAKEAVKTTSENLAYSTQLVTIYLETGKETHRTRWESLWQDEIINYLKNADAFVDNIESSRAFTEIKVIKKLVNEIKLQQQQVIDNTLQKLKTQNYYESSSNSDLAYIKAGLNSTVGSQIAPKTIEVKERSQAFITAINNLIEEEEASINRTKTYLKTAGITSVILSIIVGSILGYFVISQLYQSLYYLKQTVKQLSLGNLPEQIIDSKNETSFITQELAKLVVNLKNVKDFALRVGKGEFNTEISVFNNEGELGESLATMKESLSKVAEEDKQRNWANEGFAMFNELLRKHNSTILELSDVALKNLVNYLKANQGAIFLAKEEDENEPYLEMISCFAYNKKKYLSKKIYKGEGLAGQAWLENDTILVTDIPDDYINIKSGLGSANPRAVVVVPLTVNEETQGILELASFELFKEFQIEFIKRAAETLASAIGTARSNERTTSLLQESQELTEALRAQEEEMRQNMEELKTTQEEMQKAQNQIHIKEQNLNSVINNTQDTIFAINKNYEIIVVNQVLKDKYKKMGINLETGTKISDILPKAAWEKWKARYDKALNGKQYKVIEESSGSNGSRFSQTYHNPIFDETGEIVGVSVISRDVTDTIVLEKELKKKRSTINSIINNSSDTYFAIDKEYNILLINDALKKQLESHRVVVNEGDNILKKFPKDMLQKWKPLYDQALKGESVSTTEENKTKEKALFSEVYCNPIYNEEGEIIGVSVTSRDISRWQKAFNEKEEREAEIQKLKKALGMSPNIEESVLKAKDEKRISAE